MPQAFFAYRESLFFYVFTGVSIAVVQARGSRRPVFHALLAIYTMGCINSAKK